MTTTSDRQIFEWPVPSPSPSPPAILVHRQKQSARAARERSPSPPWGRSPSPPCRYLEIVSERRRLAQGKKRHETRWDQKTITTPLSIKSEEQLDSDSDSDSAVDALANFDPRITVKSAQRVRRKRAFAWIAQNTIVERAQSLRERAMLNFQQRSRIRESHSPALKSGDASAQSNADAMLDSMLEISDSVPDMEWWDALITPEMVTSLIEHPTILRPQMLNESHDSHAAFFLTKQERRKMRRLTRKQTHEAITDRIRLGLQEPPEPRLKISNIMRVLGSSAILDPSAMECKARAQMLKRRMKHELANETRKLSAEERRRKKRRKLREDDAIRDAGAVVHVFCVPNLKQDRKARFKICKNAEQLNLTGVCLSVPDHPASAFVIVVEGGPKGIAKYKRLIMQRIQWQSANKTDAVSLPALIWTGANSRQLFSKFVVKQFESEALRKAFCVMHNIQPYFALCKSTGSSV